ncbi:hypothetical protein L484_012373 [Morus notabilis]|uniref:Uncharacterized protein n=1 Tax=Morus notabilis TaxID=981085 RepID=W9S931_9ROSA|nr:hypothetical protein L484_012373 [Morus notabilis]
MAGAIDQDQMAGTKVGSRRGTIQRLGFTYLNIGPRQQVGSKVGSLARSKQKEPERIPDLARGSPKESLDLGAAVVWENSHKTR